MLRVAICEDNDMDMKNVHEAIKSSAYPVEVSMFWTGDDFLASFEKGLYHIVFLDIYLKDLSGIDIAHAIRAHDDKVVIVFITTSSDFTREGYCLGVLKYIEKPFEPGAVKVALDLAWRLGLNPEACTVMTKQGKREIALCDIHFIEVVNHTCFLHIKNELLQTTSNIDQLSLLLPPARFVRCHRSFIVNLEHVREVGRDFTMTTGDRVYIRGKDQKKMADLFARYLAAETRRLGDEG